MAELRFIQPKYRAGLMAQAAPFIKDAIERSEGTIDPVSVIEDVLEARKDLWCIWDNDALKTRAWLVGEPINRIYFIWVLSGEGMWEWFDLHEELEQWARKEADCKAVQFFGRPGWIKPAKRAGYRTLMYVMHKDLADG